MTEMLRFAAVDRIYPGPAPIPALRGVSLSLRAGELVTVMGPSGSGKSTLLGLAGGLDRPSAGSVTLHGQPLAGRSRAELARLRRQTVAYIFQQYNLVPLLTVAENVALPLEFDGWDAARCAAATAEALEALGMTAAAASYPESLSVGQQQRVAIARAIAGTPRLILADEPTAALDSVTGETIMRLLRERVDAGAAALVVTHDARLAARADRILHLHDGALIDDDAAPLEPPAPRKRAR